MLKPWIRFDISAINHKTIQLFQVRILKDKKTGYNDIEDKRTILCNDNPLSEEALKIVLNITVFIIQYAIIPIRGDYMSIIAYFNNEGTLVKKKTKKHENVFDDRELAYQADFYCILGRLYDLSNSQSIASMPIPTFNSSHASVLDLSYIMKIRCGTVEALDLLPSFVMKTLEMMLDSHIGWKRGDYLQVIRNYYRLNMVLEGETFEALFRMTYPKVFSNPLDVTAEGEHISTKYYFENRNRKYAEYEAVKQLCPTLVPNTIKGYLQIRTRKTKRFLTIQAECERHGLVFDFSQNKHFCRKNGVFVEISSTYNHSGRTPHIESCSCSLFKNGSCVVPYDNNGLSCIYPAASY